MTNWINSGGQAARRCTDDERLEMSARSRTGVPLSVGFALMLTALAAHLGHARDRGQFGNVNPDLKAWFESLKSGKGPCCSDADGTAISDADWESGNGALPGPGRRRVGRGAGRSRHYRAQSRRTHHGMAYPRLWRGDHPLLHAGINDMTVA